MKFQILVIDLTNVTEPSVTHALSLADELTLEKFFKAGRQAVDRVESGEVSEANKPKFFIDTGAKTRKGPKGRAVYVKAVESDSGSSLEAGMKFDTSIELSTLLGFSYNKVANELAKAEKKGDDEATINGVTLAFVDSIKA